jgi:hypothetical protein
LVIAKPRLGLTNGLAGAAPQIADARAHKRDALPLHLGVMRETPMLQRISITSWRTDLWAPNVLEPQHRDR